MTDASPPTARRVRLQLLDRILAFDPEAIDALSERAGLLGEQGLFEQAKRDYVEIIRRRPTDFAALNDFGALVLKAGYREAARSLFGEAVRHHPNHPTGHVNLGNLLLLLGEQTEARAHFETALKIDPCHIHAHRGMGNLLAELGDELGARRHRDKGFRNHFLTRLPNRGDAPPISVLLLVAAAGGNIPTSALLDDRCFQTTVLVTEYADPNAALPPHDLIFNSIGDADLCGEALEAAGTLVNQSRRPVINHPRTVLGTGRLANTERLRRLPDVVVPRMVKLPRRLLCGVETSAVAAENGFTFPLLLRAPGFHTGRHFVRVETAGQLAAAAAQSPGEEVWLIEPLDASDGGGMFRKYRVMFIEGKLYPLHLAISRNWKVHYFTADMADCAENRASDAAFLNDIRIIGDKGVVALEAILAALELDYGGIDFAVSGNGDILFFDANATMVVYPPARDPKWDYRRQAVDAILGAVHSMLVGRTKTSSGVPG